MREWTNETLTDAMVEESVNRNMERIEDRHEELQGLLSRVPPIMENTDTPESNLIRLHEIRDGVTAIAAEVSACRDGCSQCCYQAVAVTSAEADKIGKHLGIEPVDAPMMLDRDDSVAKYMAVPCPFLKKKRCSVYEVRPSACRTHFNVSSFPEVCDVVNFPNREVPTLDMRMLWMAEGVLALQSGYTLADIREFFPEGATPTQKL